MLDKVDKVDRFDRSDKPGENDVVDSKALWCTNGRRNFGSNVYNINGHDQSFFVDTPSWKENMPSTTRHMNMDEQLTRQTQNTQ